MTGYYDSSAWMLGTCRYDYAQGAAALPNLRRTLLQGFEEALQHPIRALNMVQSSVPSLYGQFRALNLSCKEGTEL